MAINFGTGKPLTAYAVRPTAAGDTLEERASVVGRAALAAVESVVRLAERAHPQDTAAPGYDPRVAMLQCGLAWEPEARLIGNVTARDVAKVAALTMTQCPACGSEAWVNIDCGLCVVVGELLSDPCAEHRKRIGEDK